MPFARLNSSISNIRNRHFLFLDVILLIFTPYFALLIRFDCNPNNVHIQNQHLLMMIFLFIVKMFLLGITGLYKRYWKYATIDDLALLILVGFYIGLSQLFVLGILRVLLVQSFLSFPLSFPLIDTILTFIFISVPRFSVRLFERAEERLNIGVEQKINTLIFGAGEAGIKTLIELQRAKDLNLRPIGFIDDDPLKKHLRIRGVSIFGDRSILNKIVIQYNISRILIAMPSVHGKELRDIIELAKGTKAQIFTLPGLSEILNGKVSIKSYKKIDIDDLLRREPIITDLDNIFDELKGMTILVTGAGGSIGSEICRQVMLANPESLLLLGHGENSIFEIEQELKISYNQSLTKIIPLIADIRNRQRIENILSQFKPNVIFHAAAHKHVPLMESNISEAITNNILGIKNLIELSNNYNVKRFVYISTDKAVNPTNVMGATKRVAELYLNSIVSKSTTKFITVRFGNVLGSRGSVVHTFKKQIVMGGPILVTHPLIERYFMTIPEAVQLVLQAFQFGNGGEIFVLDMGKRIKIVDLARDMIKLSGLNEDEIEIKFTNLRPGEKMIEELFTDNEKIHQTPHPKIFSAYLESSRNNQLLENIEELINLTAKCNDEILRDFLFSISNSTKN